MCEDLQKVIAIDGPSGSGKSTVAKRVAEELKLLYIDTGSMFRAIGYVCHQQNIPLEDDEKLKKFLESLKMEYSPKAEVLIAINGEDLTHKIRAHEVSSLASLVSGQPVIRNFLLDFQRKLAEKRTCVMEGRDIATVVFPRAFCKFFITASLEVRSQRRFLDLRQKGHKHVSYETIVNDQKKRDESDTQREVAPLKQASDAFLVDTTEKSFEEVVDFVCEYVLKRAREKNINL